MRTLLLLNTTYSVLANSVDPDQLASEETNKHLKKPTDLDLHCLSLNMWISIKMSDQVICWLEIRSGRGILIYSAWQGLIYCKLGVFTCQCVPDYYTHQKPTVAGQKSKTVPRKMHAFCQNAISFELLYSRFASRNIQALYTQKISCIFFSDCRVVLFLQDMRNENPD